MRQIAHCNSKGIGLGIAAVALLSGALAGWQKTGVSANERNVNMPPFLSERTPPMPPETATVPAGTRIHIRLKETISTEKNSSGDYFTASLDGPLITGVQLLSPSRNKIIGRLTDIEESRHLNGRARLTIVLKELIVNGKEYMLETQPLTLMAQSAKEKDAEGIVRGSAPGGGMGATEREGKGAVIGDGSGAEEMLPTKEVPTVYGPASRLTFTLSAPVELPVIRKMGG